MADNTDDLGLYRRVRTQPEEYRSEDGQTFGMFADTLHMCARCGAVVLDCSLHDSFHALMRDLVAGHHGHGRPA